MKKIKSRVNKRSRTIITSNNRISIQVTNVIEIKSNIENNFNIQVMMMIVEVLDISIINLKAEIIDTNKIEDTVITVEGVDKDKVNIIIENLTMTLRATGTKIKEIKDMRDQVETIIDIIKSVVIIRALSKANLTGLER